MRRLIDEEFVKKVKKIHPEIEVIGEYINSKTKIEVNTEYGVCDILPHSLISGRKPSIMTARDKNAFFIKQAQEIHEDRYDYSKVEYMTTNACVTIICRKHGEFQQRPNDHLSGKKGCKRCADENAEGGYNKTLAERNKEEWSQIPAIVYIIKCWDDNEDFVKIGITTNTVIERFSNKHAMPYRWEEVRVIHTDLYDAVYEESKLHDICEGHSYKPEMKFAGYTECFVDVPLEIKFGKSKII